VKKPPVLQIRRIQGFLFDYLSTKVDPYDFPHYFLEEWGNEVGVEIGDDDHADSLKPDQLKAYGQWLIDNEKGVQWVQDDPYGSAAYLTFDEVSKMPKGTWGIHFTHQEPFDSFERGITLEGLHLSTWRKEKVQADCGKNLTEDIGPYEHVWIFAFEALRHPQGRVADPVNYGINKYGKNAVLFQTDGAVRAWHPGDEEYQLIFPACSEYNVVPLYEPYYGHVGCTLRGGEEVLFPTVTELIKYLEGDGEREVGKRIKTLDC
jgi:hypothetical protein